MKEKINEIIKDRSGFNEVESKDNLALDLELDSLDQVELAMVLEQKFNIQIPDSKLDGLETVQDVYDLIESLTE